MFRHHWAVVSVVALTSVSACKLTEEAKASDDAVEFAALQVRGAQAMGVDQYSSTHLFDSFADGGRIELQRDVDDPAGVEQIRSHLRQLADAFESGSFDTPAFVHARVVPGASDLAALAGSIQLVYGDLPRGGELRLVSTDPDAIRAIHEFMEFQRQEHHAAGAVEGVEQHHLRHLGQSGHDPVNHSPHPVPTGHHPSARPNGR